MTRIIAGEFGGRKLQTPPGRITRPTSDRTREGMFSSIEATHDLSAGAFIDLYAGSGAVGLEAISRGARTAYLVERDRDAARSIRENIASLGLTDRAILVESDVARTVHAGARNGATVFVDPPYDVAADDLKALLGSLLEAGLCNSGALVIVERSRRDRWRWPQSVETLRERRYGESTLWYGLAL